jgi:hypothetical protein
MVGKRQQSLASVTGPKMNVKMNKNNHFILFVISFLIFNSVSCFGELGNTVILTPDKYSHVYEAKDSVILKAIAGVFREKNIGSRITINYKDNYVDSDYVVSGDWRTKAAAYVRKINWKECEVVLAVITEKKTKNGWEMRRLLQKEQYDTFFSVIDLRIYEEMSLTE